MSCLRELKRWAGNRARSMVCRARHARNRLTRRAVRAQGPPNQETLDFLATTGCRSIAEIGVEWGSTSEGMLRYLGGEGVLHLFDYQDRIDLVARRLRVLGYSNFVGHGNTRLLYDSYNWSMIELLKQEPTPHLDYVYLDGAHTWTFDALAFCLLDRLLVPGGYIDFDDYHWTIDDSPTVNPRVFPVMRKLYTREQMETPQVRLIVDLLVRRGGEFKEVVPDKIFQKR